MDKLEEGSSSLYGAIYVEETYDNHLEATLDQNEHVISERFNDGILHENIGIKTPYIETEQLTATTISGDIDVNKLSDQTLSDFESALKANGFSSGTGDWTEHKSLTIPQPRCAMINITGIDAMPTTKTQDLKAVLHIWDM